MKIVFGKFWLPDNTTRFVKMRIDVSTIANAGLGCFTLELLPKGSRGIYRGKWNDNYETVGFYTWELWEFDRTTGKTISERPIGVIDSTDPKDGNWTRYVNCGVSDKANNMKPVQRFRNLYYEAVRDIKAGEELFIDYGKEYRQQLKLYYYN